MLVGYLYSQGVGLDGTSTTMLSCFSFFGGMMISMVVSKVMSSAVATVIVCFADDHNALETTHPDEYRALSDAWIDCNCHPAVSKQGILDVESPMVIDPTFPRSYVANRGTYKPPKGYAGLPVSDNGLEYEKEKEATLSKFTQRSNLAGLQRDEDDEEVTILIFYFSLANLKVIYIDRFLAFQKSFTMVIELNSSILLISVDRYFLE